MQVGLGPGHTVRWGPISPPPKGYSPHFRPYLLWPNGWMDEDATWYGGTPRPKRLCVRWRPAPLPKKGGGGPSPILGPCPLWPNSWVNQDGTWYRGGPWPRPRYARQGPSSLPKKVAETPPQFSAHFYCGQTVGCIKMPLGMEAGLSPGNFVLDRDPAPPPQKGGSAPNFQSMSIVAKRLDG